MPIRGRFWTILAATTKRAKPNIYPIGETAGCSRCKLYCDNFYSRALLRRVIKVDSPLPTVDMITEVNQAVSQAGFSRIGILGTRTVMETRFYGGLTDAAIIPPSGQDLTDVHDAYVTMAASGVVSEVQRSVFNRVSRRLLNEGAQAIMLGRADLASVYDQQTSEFPLVDCASIHVDAIVRFALA